MVTVRQRLAGAALFISIAAISGAACRTASIESAPPLVQPGAPGGPGRTITPAEAIDLSQVRHTDADVRFMQAMVAHHAQALEMAALVPARSGREDVRLLARRIERSQADEIELMRRWLQVRGEDLPSVHAQHAHGAAAPGMLTEEEMRRLAQAEGSAFDRLFLQSMIRHHKGALTMVAELVATAEAAQEPEVFAFASDIDADQRMEIARMRVMLAGTR